MATIEKSIDVSRPLQAVYRQWTKFEDYPRFLSEVVAVHHVAAGCMRWRTEIGDRRRDTDIEIIEQVPNRRVAWATRGRGGGSGMVTLYPLSPERTRVMLQLAYPSEELPSQADPVATVRDLVLRGLKAFKRLVEGHAEERSDVLRGARGRRCEH
ncbi:MAG: SRPBCC family protein [Gammaproteobacteria bacterium]|nr:SRPBCC family protein [Gammaproteobacteria bacterium]